VTTRGKAVKQPAAAATATSKPKTAKCPGRIAALVSIAAAPSSCVQLAATTRSFDAALAIVAAAAAAPRQRRPLLQQQYRRPALRRLAVGVAAQLGAREEE